jgi:hypothetical protein
MSNVPQPSAALSISDGDRKRKLNTLAKQKSRQNRNEQEIIAEREKNKLRERKNQTKKAEQNRLNLSKVKPQKDKYLGMKPLHLSVVEAAANEKPAEIKKQPTRIQASRGTKTVSIDNNRNKCGCTVNCGSECTNNATFEECTVSNCNIGGYCGNQWTVMKHFITDCFPSKKDPVMKGTEGFGICALEDIPSGSIIGEYRGEITEKRSEYTMSLKNGKYVDAKRKGNLLRFINHKCHVANCKCVVRTIESKGVSNNTVWICSTREIKKDEYLYIDYGGDDKNYKWEWGWDCTCGENNCRKPAKQP